MALTEAKIILSYILLNYKVVPDPKRKIEMSAQSSFYAPKDDRLVLFYKLWDVGLVIQWKYNNLRIRYSLTQ